MLRPVRYLVAPVALVVLAGCGDTQPPPEDLVRSTVASFARATAAKDYRTMCDRLLAPELVERVESVGLSCEDALDRGLGEVEDPRLSIGEVSVKGDAATVETRTSAAGQEPSADTLRLVNIDGTWKISSLGT
jgi:Putative lumazine-binding